MKYSVALFIGRFQPFHLGHLYSLKKCLEIADSVIVGIGSSQESGTENNPWDFETRKKMVESLDLQGLALQVVAIPDLHNDQKWGAQILDLVQELGYEPGQILGVGNNDWTNGILRNIGIEVYETGLYKRDELEGIGIRELMKNNNDSWNMRVPECVVQLVEKYEK